MAAAAEFSRAERRAFGHAPTEIAASYEDVAFRSADGLTLRGWFFSASPDRAVIVVHGRHSTRLEAGPRTVQLSRLLLRSGYSVLLFDLRGHGTSEGERFSLGQHERADVAAAIEHLAARGFAPARVALLGMSMGAGTAIQTLALRPDVGPIVADSAYSSGRLIVEEKAPEATGLPPWATPGILLAAKLLFGLDADQADPLATVRAHPERPFLFIHCARDGLIDPHHALALRAASAHPASELWLAPDCGHAGAHGAHRGEYEARLLAFLAAHAR